jgi:hypothetical protein
MALWTTTTLLKSTGAGAGAMPFAGKTTTKTA